MATIHVRLKPEVSYLYMCVGGIQRHLIQAIIAITPGKHIEGLYWDVGGEFKGSTDDIPIHVWGCCCPGME